MHPIFDLSQISTTPAEVELRLEIDPTAAAIAKSITIVSASIRGPFCEYASTLPATIPFRRTQKQSELFKATVPDPCYWTPLMPHLYRVEIQYQSDELQTETVRFERGLQRCEVRNNFLFIDGERTIIRGIGWNEFESEPDWKELRATRTSLVVLEWNNDFAAKCSKHGIPLYLSCTEKQIVEKQINASDFPAFHGTIAAGGGVALDSAEKYQARVTVVTQSQNSAAQQNQLVFAVANTRNATRFDWTEKRKACDVLQAEVATIGEFAGYIVL